MSLAAERIRTILQEIDTDAAEVSRKTAQEVAEILLQERSADSAAQQEPAVHSGEVQSGEQAAAASGRPIYDVHALDAQLKEVNAKWIVHYYREIPRYGVDRLERIKIFAKRLIRKLMRSLIEPMAHEIQEFHAAVTNTLNAMRNNDVVFDAHIRAIESGNIQRDGQIQSLVGSMQVSSEKCMELDGRIQAVEQGALQREMKIVELMATLQEREQVMAKLSEQLIYLNERAMEHQEINAKLQQLVEQAAAMEAQCKDIDTLCNNLKQYQEEQQKKQTEEAQSYLDIDYFDFENNFRGTRTQIKESQKMYLRYYEDCKNVLDLGSGRGEFLELLAEKKIHATGVDMYHPFVDYCRMRGYTVVCDDAVDYLRHQKDASCDGIFAAQLAEHLSTKDLLDLCKESYRVLEDGKTLILETPNPACMSIYMNSFYLDPTHSKPVHPKTLEYFLKKAGFSKVEVVYTEQSKVGYRFPLLDAAAGNLAEFNDGVNFMSDIIFGSQDYAIIAVK